VYAQIAGEHLFHGPLDNEPPAARYSAVTGKLPASRASCRHFSLSYCLLIVKRLSRHKSSYTEICENPFFSKKIQKISPTPIVFAIGVGEVSLPTFFSKKVGRILFTKASVLSLLTRNTGTLNTFNEVSLAEEVDDDQRCDYHKTDSILNSSVVKVCTFVLSIKRTG